MADQEKEKDKSNPPVPAAEPVAPAPKAPASEQEDAQNFFGEPLVGLDPGELNGTLIVMEG